MLKFHFFALLRNYQKKRVKKGHDLKVLQYFFPFRQGPKENPFSKEKKTFTTWKAHKNPFLHKAHESNVIVNIEQIHSINKPKPAHKASFGWVVPPMH